MQPPSQHYPEEQYKERCQIVWQTTQQEPGSGGTERSGESSATQTAETSIRVDTTKLDFLVDAVGELVIAQTMVNQSDAIRRDEKLRSDISQVTKIVRDVQEAAMAMRMVPIGHTFRKMRRLVRDVSRKAGKQVELQISGEDTELDKSVIEEIGERLGFVATKSLRLSQRPSKKKNVHKNKP